MMETLMKMMAAIGAAATVCDPMTIDSVKYQVPDPEPGEKPDTTAAGNAASENHAGEELAQESPTTLLPGFKWRSPVDQ